MEPEQDDQPHTSNTKLLLTYSAMIVVAWIAIVVWGQLDPFMFSNEITHRLQMESWLNGQGALQATPYTGMPDWCWGQDGMQQCWGLGIPILRLLFDLPMRIAGLLFPDRLLLLVLSIAASTTLFRGFHLHLRSHTACPLLASGLATLVFLWAPSFLVLLRSRFGVYEEVIACAYLWNLLILGLTLAALEKPSLERLIPLALVAGFGPFIRPTVTFYAAAGFGVTLLYAWKQGIDLRRLALFGVLFAVGPLALMTFNVLRFGHPLEFGYTLNLSRLTDNVFVLRFDVPFHATSLWDACKELGWWLMVGPDPQTLLEAENPRAQAVIGEPSLFRFRAYPFRVLRGLDLPLALAGIAITSGVSVATRTLDIKSWLALFALCALVALSGFYLYSPAMVSRYTADFIPAIVMGHILLVWSWLASPKPSQIPLKIAGAVAITALLVAPLQFIHTKAHPFQGKHARFERNTGITRTQLETQIKRRKAHIAQTTPVLSSELHCPYQNRFQNLPAHRVGWHSKTCQTDATLTLYMPTHPCVSVRLQPHNDAPTVDVASQLRIKSDYSLLTLVHTANTPKDTTLTYCLEGDRQILNPTQVVTLAWASLGKSPASVMHVQAHPKPTP